MTEDFYYAREIVEDGRSLLCMDAYEFIRLAGDFENRPAGELSGDFLMLLRLFN